MPQEIERKFLVSGDFKPFVRSSTHIVQGYLKSGGQCSVRVRIRDDRAYLTIKGPSLDGGLSRYEWEKEIPVEDASDLLSFCEDSVIDKERHLVPVGRHVFEVDVFHGENEGLVLAEVELSSVDEHYERPQWLGEEVSGDRHYYNSFLSKCPYKTWKSESDASMKSESSCSE